MSECIHIPDGEGHDIGYICRGGPYKYLPRIHRTGARTWELIGEPVETILEAFTVLGTTLEGKGRNLRSFYNRADILAVEAEPSYYEPHQVYEVQFR